MARVLIRSLADGVIQDRQGNVSAGTTVSIRNTDGTAATTWTAETGGSSTTADLVADVNGYVPNWIEEGTYDFVVNAVSTRVPVLAGRPAPLVLSADTTPVTASTTLVNVGLAIPITASATEIWFAEFFLLVNAGNATMDAKFGFTVPASATMLWGTLGGLSSEIPSFGGRGPANTPNVLSTEGGAVQAATNTGTSGQALAALIFGGGTAGNVQLQFAQATSDAGALKLLKGSFVQYRRLQA